jgi:hypothetical protein
MQVIHNSTLIRATIPCGGGALTGTPANESIGEQLTPAAIAAGWRYCIEAPAIAHQKSEGWTDDGQRLTQYRTPYSAEELSAQAAQAEDDRAAREAAAAAADAAWKAYQAELDNAERITKALALTILDELNRATTRIRAFDAAVAAATSLANLQTRVAALPAIPDRTVEQLKTSVRARAQEFQ